MIKALMLGAGHSPLERKLSVVEWPVTQWVSLDMNPDSNPDALFDLGAMERGATLPFEDGEFNEIHAYDVLEHYGQQGDYKGFFRGFKELWRVLQPRGDLYGICPKYDHDWAWGDPGHTRVITAGTLGYLTREMYDNLGELNQTDYRRYVAPCWWSAVVAEYTDAGLRFCLRKTP
jgi:hypothetical protein